MPTSSLVQNILNAAYVLTGTLKLPSTAHNGRPANERVEFSDLLRQRLGRCLAVARSELEPVAKDDGINDLLAITVQDIAQAGEIQLKLLTARAALSLLVVLQQLENLEHQQDQQLVPSTSKTPAPPTAALYGMNDIKVIQTLASLVARWGLAANLDAGLLPPEMQEKQDVGRIVSDEDEVQRLQTLDHFSNNVITILGTSPTSGSTPGVRGEIQTSILPHLLLPVLAARLLQDHYSGCQSSSAEQLLRMTNPSTAMTALMSLLAPNKGKTIKPSWLAPTISTMLSRQLMRPGGVVALLQNMLGRSTNDIQLHQLEHVARLLVTPPTGADADHYFDVIMPRILAVIRPPPSNRAPPPSFLRALCFCISRLITTKPEIVRIYVLSAFSLSGDDIAGELDLLAVLIANIDPSPINYAFLLDGILTKLFSLYFFVLETHTDPIVREIIDHLLHVWGRTLSVSEIVCGISKMLSESPTFAWTRNHSGGLAAESSAGPSTSTVLLSTDFLNLKPNPNHIASWLKKLDRSEIVAILITQWLDEVRSLRAERGLNADFASQKQIILRLQLLQETIAQCGSEVVRDAKHTLIFIDHALEIPALHTDRHPKQHSNRKRVPTTKGLSLDDLKIIDSSDEDDLDEIADDPEFPELEGIRAGEELSVTGLTLLLSLLEGNADLTFENAPTLHSVSLKVNALKDSQTPTIARLARDAAMVLSLRRAASSAITPTKGGVEDAKLRASHEMYQEALKLLQDPILPVRAQGLGMLRSLVASKDQLLVLDAALIPAILDIFVQAIQDDDSFLYLNAVQGISTMVDSFGREVATRLMTVYSGRNIDDVGEGERGRRELDKRLRIGEAMVQIIQRSAQALPVYSGILVPPLLRVLRAQTLPIALRSSALTILATAAEEAPLSLLSQSETLISACLDLLSVESQRTRPMPEKDETPNALERAPTHPSLRRGAILFLSLMLRASPDLFPARVLERMRTVLGYVQATDADPLVRHNAGEVVEDVETLLPKIVR